MFAYTICFIQRGDELLLLNREKPAWMGCWNGIGGKIEQGETPRQSMLREIEEETGITGFVLRFKGVITWRSEEGANYGGMYTYVAEVPEGYAYTTPVRTAEGILDWKGIGWIMHPDNDGIATNIPLFLKQLLEDNGCCEYGTVYRGDDIISHFTQPIHPGIEYEGDVT